MAVIAEKEKYRRVRWIERAASGFGDQFASGSIRSALRAVYHRLMLCGTFGRGIRCELPGGEIVRVLPSHRFAAWSEVEYKAFKSATRVGDLVLDIGANVGAYTSLFGQWVGSTGKVYAFEPAPETFAALQQHVALNGLETVVVPLAKAISDRKATLVFFAENFQGTNRLASERESGEGPGTLKVDVLTVDEFCAQLGVLPNVIKIDIEGFELAALRGARHTIKSSGSRIALFVEMHPTTWRTLGITREEVLAEIEFQGLKAEPLVNNGNPWEIEGVCMRLCRK